MILRAGLLFVCYVVFIVSYGRERREVALFDRTVNFLRISPPLSSSIRVGYWPVGLRLGLGLKGGCVNTRP